MIVKRDPVWTYMSDTDKTQRRRHHKSKTGVSVSGPTKKTCLPKIKKKQVIARRQTKNYHSMALILCESFVRFFKPCPWEILNPPLNRAGNVQTKDYPSVALLLYMNHSYNFKPCLWEILNPSLNRTKDYHCVALFITAWIIRTKRLDHKLYVAVMKQLRILINRNVFSIAAGHNHWNNRTCCSWAATLDKL